MAKKENRIPISRILGNRLRAIRNQYNLSQERTAELCGVNHATIRLFEIGSRLPSFRFCMTFCEVFGVSLDEIIKYRTRTIKETYSQLQDESPKNIIEEFLLIDYYEKQYVNS